MNSQRIINELLAQGQDAMTPEIQDRMIDIITGKQNDNLLQHILLAEFTVYMK